MEWLEHIDEVQLNDVCLNSPELFPRLLIPDEIRLGVVSAELVGEHLPVDDAVESLSPTTENHRAGCLLLLLNYVMIEERG